MITMWQSMTDFEHPIITRCVVLGKNRDGVHASRREAGRYPPCSLYLLIRSGVSVVTVSLAGSEDRGPPIL